VSVERVTSGLGLPRIYEYLSQKKAGTAHPEAAALINSRADDVGRIIAEYATNRKVSEALYSYTCARVNCGI
jgi:glucokinase